MPGGPYKAPHARSLYKLAKDGRRHFALLSVAFSSRGSVGTALKFLFAMDRRERLLPRERLLQYVGDPTPKLLLLEAPAGYGKSVFARQFVDVGRVAFVDALGADALEFHRRLFQGLLSTYDGADAEDHRQRALTFETIAAWRSACVRLWSAAHDGGDLLLENMENVVDAPDILRTLEELFAHRVERRVILCSRIRLPIRFGRFAYPHEIVRLGMTDLRFAVDELAALFSLPADDERVAVVDDVTRGWPIAALLLRRLQRSDPTLHALPSQESAHLFEVLAGEVIALLSSEAREALVTIVALADATLADVVAAIGPSGEAAISELLRDAPFIERYGDALQAHPLLRELLGGREPTAIRRAAERAARGHLALGNRLRAAQIFVQLGDQVAALEAIRGLERPAWTGTPSYELGMVIGALDRSTLMLDPSVWSAATVYGRALKISAREWLHEGLEIWERHHRTMGNDVALSVIAAIINACMNEGMLDDCGRWLDRMRERAPDALLYRMWRTAIDAMRGRPLDPQTLERELVPAIAAGHPRAMYLYDVIVRIHRLRGDRDAERAAAARAVDMALATRLPVTIANTSFDAAFGAWLAGEDALYRDYLALARQVAEASDDVPSYFFACLDGSATPAQQLPGKLKTRAYAYLIGAAESTANRSTLLGYALKTADLSMQPYALIITRAALAAAEPARRTILLAEAAALAADVDSPRLREAVAAAQRGIDHPMFAPLHRRFRQSVVDRSFDVITGRLHIDHAQVELSDRQLEFVTMLAVHRRGVHRDEIVAVMWPEADLETAHGALRTLVSRLRKLKGVSEVVVTTSDGYALAASVLERLQRVRVALARFDAGESSGIDWNEVAHAFDDLLRRDRSRMTRWEWFAATERDLEILQDRVGHALMRRALADDPRTTVDIGRKLLAENEFDSVARELIIDAFHALGDVGAAQREIDALEAHSPETSTGKLIFPRFGRAQSQNRGPRDSDLGRRA